MEKLSENAFLINATVGFALFGLIWLVQLVQYPLFRFLDSRTFLEAHAFHSQWITPVVAPLMVVELVTALAILFARPAGISKWVATVIFGLALVTWLNTFLQAVPLHEKLQRHGKSLELIDNLIWVSWLRCSAWTLKSLLCFWLLAKSL